MNTTLTPVKLSQFMGRLNPFAMQTSQGGYIPIHRKIILQDLIDHLKGIKTYGTYVIREDGMINFTVIDIDGIPGDDMKIWLTVAQRIVPLFPEFKRCLEFSGRRGYHVWIFTDNPEYPQFMRELVKSRLRTEGFRNIEIYPKQNKVDPLHKKLGSLIKLPCGKHQKGSWSKILEWRNKDVL